MWVLLLFQYLMNIDSLKFTSPPHGSEACGLNLVFQCKHAQGHFRIIVQCAFVISLNEYFTIVLSLVLLVLFLFNPLHLNITMCILHIILYTFPKVLTKVNEYIG